MWVSQLTHEKKGEKTLLDFFTDYEKVKNDLYPPPQHKEEKPFDVTGEGEERTEPPQPQPPQPQPQPNSEQEEFFRTQLEKFKTDFKNELLKELKGEKKDED